MLRCIAVAIGLLAASPALADSEKQLWDAAKSGDAKTVEALLEQGTDVNAKTEYGATALSYAAEKGHLEVVQILIRHEADVNVKDTFYKVTPMTWALSKGHAEIVGALAEAGAEGVDQALTTAVATGKVDVVRALIEKGKPSQEALDRALASAGSRPKIAEILKKSGAKPAEKPGPKPEEEPNPADLSRYEGSYASDAGVEMTVVVEDGKLGIRYGEAKPAILTADGEGTFRNGPLTVTFRMDGGKASEMDLVSGENKSTYKRVEAKPAEPMPKPAAEDTGEVKVPLNWPQFRGPGASGVADGQHPPVTWDVEKGVNVRWKTPIPGLGHSCPVVWGDRVFITSAVSEQDRAGLKPGNYGNVDSVEDRSEHEWHVYCVDKNTGEVVWDRLARKGKPQIKRHLKGTHANPTPASDGTHLAVSFGSEGLYCYDLDGNLLWQRDLGKLASGWFYDDAYEWGFGSSPIIYRGMVIIQCDIGEGSFLAAYRVQDGEEVWRTPREEIPSWGTPTVVEGPERVELVTNATRFARGYDPLTGKELWRLGPFSEITVPTPFYARGLIFVTSGYRPVQPIYAVKPGASGDISPKDDETANGSVAWSTRKGGPYLPTPIVYGEHFYACSNSGMVSCYDARTGEKVYDRERLGGGGAYTGSPVAADGRLYFPAESGDVRVVKAGPEFELLAVNPLGEVCMTTPAISDGMIFFRTEHHLIALGVTAGE